MCACYVFTHPVTAALRAHPKVLLLLLFLQANRFARDTGHSVALFSVGGLYSDMDEVVDLNGDSYIVDVKHKDNTPVAQNLKVAVLKYGTGGVAKQLITRAEIVKFISARGSKALTDMYNAAVNNDNPSA